MTNELTLSPEDIAAGWKVQESRERPVPGDTLVELLFACGEKTRHRSLAGSWSWSLEQGGYTIVAYRVVQPVAEKTADPSLSELAERFKNAPCKEVSGRLFKRTGTPEQQAETDPEREKLLAQMRDPNAAMIQRDMDFIQDLKKAIVESLEAKKAAPRSPLLTVASIPKTGFSLWGADHG